MEETLGTWKPNDWDPVSHRRQNGFEVEALSISRKEVASREG